MARILVYTDWKALPVIHPTQVTVTLTTLNGPGSATYTFTPGLGSGDPGIDSAGVATFLGPASQSYHVAIQAQTGLFPLGTAERDVTATASGDTAVYLPVHPTQIGLPPAPPSVCGTGFLPFDLEGDNHWMPVLGDPTPVEAYGQIRASWFADDDLPGDHQGHDRNFSLVPDADYAGMLADSNDTDDLNDGRRILECEWDSGYNPKHTQTSFPVATWPIVGDRIWISGPWIYDCFHAFPGHQIPVHSEIHVWPKSPTPEAIAVTRFDPTIFYPTDAAPSLTYRTYSTLRAGFGVQEYVYDVPLPPEPATASLVYRIDQPLPPGVSMDFTPILPPDALQVGDPISRLSRAGIQSRTPRLRVHLKLTASAGAAGYSGTFTAGWWQPTTTLAYRAAQVRFDTLDIKAKHRSVGSQASWWLWVQAGDQWLDANANPALHAIPPGISAESVTLGLSTAPFFVLDPSTAGTLGSLYQDGFPKTCLSAGITNTGWRSGDLDANFGCSTCLTSLDKNASLGTVVLTLAEGSTGSVPVPAAGSYLFGPLLTDPPGNVDNPPPDARGDLALWGAVTTLKVYPAGLRNPLAH